MEIQTPHWVTILILMSALGSAIWNVHVKKSENSWAFIALMVVPQMIIALPLLIISPVPELNIFFYIIPSAVIQTVYIIFLTNAYKNGLVSRVYPIAIGIAPLISLAAGVFLFQTHLLADYYFGILILSFGVMGFAFVGKRSNEIISIKGLWYAFGTGSLIFLYSTIDAKGIHEVSNPFSYISWLFIIKGTLLLIPMLFLFKAEMQKMIVSREYIYAGLLAGFGYSVAIIAFRYSATSVVLALRSTSILFVFILSIYVLEEKSSLKVLMLTIFTAVGVFLILKG